jgi:hypothetical protein
LLCNNVCEQCYQYHEITIVRYFNYLSFFYVICGFCILSSAFAHRRDWTEIRVSSDTVVGINDLFFADSATGYLCTLYSPYPSQPWIHAYRWYRTINGGNSWEKVTFTGISPSDTNYIGTLQHCTPTPNSIFLAKGAPLKKIIYSLDRGLHWDSVSTHALDFDQFFTMFTEKKGIGIGYPPGKPTLVKASNGVRDFSTTTGDSMFSASIANNKFQSQFFTPAGDFSSQNVGCLIIADSSLHNGCGLTSIITETSGNTWKKYNTIFPGYETDTLYGDIKFQQGTSNVWEFPFRQTWSPTFSVWARVYLLNHPSFNISYCYSSDYGKTWGYDTSYYLRSSAVFGVSPGNVWMLLLDNSINTYGEPYPPAHIIAHTTDYGQTWDLDSASLNVPDIGKFDGRIFYFKDKSHGWLAGLLNNIPYVFKFKPENSSVEMEDLNRKFSGLAYEVSPNPCVNSVVITCFPRPSIQKVELFDFLGRQFDVPTSIESNSITLNTKELHSGVWVALISHSGGYSTARFIVQK